jgi:dephospho-CoA kinase
MQDLVTEVWAVTCDRQQQLQRLINRNQLSKNEAIERIAAWKRLLNFNL